MAGRPPKVRCSGEPNSRANPTIAGRRMGVLTKNTRKITPIGCRCLLAGADFAKALLRARGKLPNFPCQTGKRGKKSISGREIGWPIADNPFSIIYLPIRLSAFRQRPAGKIFSLPSAWQGNGRETCTPPSRPCSGGPDCACLSRRRTSPASRNSYASIVTPGWRGRDPGEGVGIVSGDACRPRRGSRRGPDVADWNRTIKANASSA